MFDGSKNLVARSLCTRSADSIALNPVAIWVFVPFDHNLTAECYLCGDVQEGWVGEGSNSRRLGQRGFSHMVLDGMVSTRQVSILNKVKRWLGH